MVQIARTPLSNNVAFHIALRKIFGLGSTTSLQISETCGISAELKVRDVKEPYIHKVAQYIQDNYTVGDQLRREVRQNILRLMDIKCYRGTRHDQALSISGRTHSNSQTARKLKHHIMLDTSR
uniref:Ribosomal protein S13 n=1 Tax=Dunaliella tertiolecta TaxID=3047 RepID=A0A7S3RAC8_DUNTE|mmetsp:Transcript_19692/g.54977  ORF Transcript_19692/g.54977 Transcript_19692/m.54977 type:complete len:123 (+) Transcript_19692:154-522(+)